MVNINKINIDAKHVSFGGIKKFQDDYGFKMHKFFYPYDTEKFDGAVEIFAVNKKQDGNYEVNPKPLSIIGLDEKGSSPDIDLDNISKLNNNSAFAYRFVFTDKQDKTKVQYAFDPGVVIGLKEDSNYSDIDPKSNRNRMDNKFNLILPNGVVINKSGAMQLIMPDEYNPGINFKDGEITVNQALRNKVLSSVRTHINKLGGGFAGIMQKLPTLSKEGYTRIVGMPLTKDTVSSHLYWTQNAYQLAPQLGSIEVKNGKQIRRETMKDYRLFQQELFKNGIDWVSDAALVNEGLQGIHFSHLLRHGIEDSPYKYWFKNDEYKKLGIIPENAENTRIKLVNAPLTIKTNENGDKVLVKNPNYDAKSPTYIQMYDSRLVSKEQETDDTKVFLTYDKNNSSELEQEAQKNYSVETNPDSYDIKKHDDMVYPYYFAVDPKVLTDNISKAQKGLGSAFNIEDINSIKEIVKFPYYSIDNKAATAGFELWDGNVDIAKLNFYIGNQDQEKINSMPEEYRAEEMEKMTRSIYNVQDYAITSGKYWTELTRDIQLAYCAKQLRGLGNDAETIKKKLDKLASHHIITPNASKTMSKEIIQNVLNQEYMFPKLTTVDMRSSINPEGEHNNYSLKDFILRNAMDYPLEAAPVSDDVTGVLGSPIISKKANNAQELNVSRYDLMKAGDKNVPSEYRQAYSMMNDVYESVIAPKIETIVAKAGLINKVSESGQVTDLGKYILSEITPELTQYLIVKGLAPDAEIDIDEQGYFDYTNVDTSAINLNRLGITAYGMPDSITEAKELVKVLKKGISNISDSDLEKLSKVVEERFNDADLLSYQLADVIIDKTESGMGWRIDAAKDIAALDAVRQGYDSFETAWDSVINFWGKYREAVASVNPHVYTAAEITDVDSFFKASPNGRFENPSDAVRKFLMETGITTLANYDYLYSILPEMYTLNQVEKGHGNWMAEKSDNITLREKFDHAWTGNAGFMFQGPIESIIESYTFLGNHDKPRVMHFLALDMGLFQGSLENKKDIVSKVLNKRPEEIDISAVKGPAIAMGLRLQQAVDSVKIDKDTAKALKNSIASIAGGEFKGKAFNSEFFGARPFEIAIANVFEDAESKGLKLPQETKDKYQAEILKSILEPAFDRFYTLYKSMITFPGNMTDFAGDKIGVSGFETPSKNVYQQNRPPIRWEWLEKDNKNYKFIQTFYKNMNDILSLRSRPELSALNNGIPITLPQRATFNSSDTGNKKQYNRYFQAVMRYNEEGSVVVTLYNSSGSNTPNNLKMQRKEKETLTWDSKDGTRQSYISLSNELADAKQSMKAGLKEGTIFLNARENNNNPAKYYIVTKSKDGEYRLEGRDKDDKPCDIVIEADDMNALILYKK